MKKRLLCLLLGLCGSIAGTLYAQDPDIEENERSLLEELFRSSEVPGQVPTASRAGAGLGKRVSAPAGALRVGCICMDDSRSASRSSGACSGRGGVRYWLYRTQEGDTTRVLTLRHERHPHALDSVERSEVNQPKRPETAPKAGNQVAPIIIQPAVYPLMPPGEGSRAVAVDGGWFDWSDAATISGGGLMLYLTVRMILHWISTHQALVRYALRHLLRFRKRPKTRKSSPNPPKARQ